MHSSNHRRIGRGWVLGTAVAVVAAVAAVLLVTQPWGQPDPPRVGTAPLRASPAARGVATSAVATSDTPSSAATSTTATTERPSTTVTTEPPSTTTTKAKVAEPLLTSCHSVLHIGDSTSESLVSADYLPDPLQRLTARYAAVGVVSEDMQISGARSIVETYAGQPNAYTVAQQAVAAGYKGCWVVAMGVNDAADIAVGSNVDAPERIQRMMSVIGAQPVMWVAVRTLVSSGPYSEANMAAWNVALLHSCPSYPNMRVMDWPSEVQASDYISDGIHYSSAGSAVYSAALAAGLATSFPRSGTSPSGCLVP